MQNNGFKKFVKIPNQKVKQLSDLKAQFPA